METIITWRAGDVRRYVAVTLLVLTGVGAAGGLPGIEGLAWSHALLLFAAAYALLRPDVVQWLLFGTPGPASAPARPSKVAALPAPAAVSEAPPLPPPAATATGDKAPAGPVEDAAGLEPPEPLPSGLADRVEEVLNEVVTDAGRLLDAVGRPAEGGGAAPPTRPDHGWTQLVNMWPTGPVVLRDPVASHHRYILAAPLAVPAEHAFRLLTDERNWMIRHDGEPGLKGYSDLLQGVRQTRLAANTGLLHLHTRHFGLASARDVLVVMHRRRLPDGTLAVASFSVDDDRHPPTSAAVRIHVFSAGALVTAWPGDPERCYAVYLTHADPKMWVPSTLVSSLSRQLAPVAYKVIHRMVRKAPRWDPAHAAQKEAARAVAAATAEAAVASLGEPAAADAALAASPRVPAPAAATRRGARGPVPWLAVLARVRATLQWSAPFVLGILYIVFWVHVARAMLARRRQRRLLAQ